MVITFLHFNQQGDSAYRVVMPKRITIELDEVAGVAFDMLLAAMRNGDPGAQWTPEKLAASMIEGVLEDDLACEPRPVMQS